MKGLKPFRHVPMSLVEWSRWCSEQSIPEDADITVTESQVSDLGDYITTTVIKSGEGTPEAAVTGTIGQLYLRTDGGASTTLYVKESGVGTNTGWIAK